MNVGSKATLECPAELAYGDVMKAGIPENSDLEFDVELLACAADELENVDIKQMAASADIQNGQDELMTLPNNWYTYFKSIYLSKSFFKKLLL